MSKRNLFQVGATLLGIYFVVLGFQLVADGGLRTVMFLQTSPATVSGVAAMLFIWSYPLIYLTSGLLLLAKGRRWADRLFEPEAKRPSYPTPMTVGVLLRVGLMLLGVYFLVSNINGLVKVAWVLSRQDDTKLSYSDTAALFLVVAISVAFLFQSRWVVGLLTGTLPPPDLETATIEPIDEL